MKRLRPLLVAFAILFTAYQSSAQSAFSGLIKAGPEDATKLLNAYAALAVGANMPDICFRVDCLSIITVL